MASRSPQAPEAGQSCWSVLMTVIMQNRCTQGNAIGTLLCTLDTWFQIELPADEESAFDGL